MRAWSYVCRVDLPLISSVTFLQFIRIQNRGAVRESLNMSGLQSLRILTLVLVSVVAAVDTGSGGFLSIGNLYFKLLLLLLLCSLS